MEEQLRSGTLSGAGGDSTSLPRHTLPCGDGWRAKLPPPGLAPVITNGLSAADTVGREITGCLGLMDELWRLLRAPRKPCSHHSRRWVTRASRLGVCSGRTARCEPLRILGLRVTETSSMESGRHICDRRPSPCPPLSPSASRSSRWPWAILSLPPL